MNSRNQTSLPLLFIAIAAFSLHFGVYPLSFILIPEIMPENVINQLFEFEQQSHFDIFYFQIRIYAVTFVFSMMWALMFAFSYGEWILVSHLTNTNYIVLITFIVFNLISAIIFLLYVPSTKKKSYGDIFSELNFGINNIVDWKSLFVDRKVFIKINIYSNNSNRNKYIF